MDVHVDEAGKQGPAGQVDPARVGGDPHLALAADRRDPAVDDHHHRFRQFGAGEHVDHPVGGDRDRLGSGRGGGEGGGHCGEGERLHHSSPWTARQRAAAFCSGRM
jgi:hypothetical protein